MPPKAKKEKDGSKDTGKRKAEASPAADTGLSTDELLAKVEALEAEKRREQDYRNYMQLERDKVNSFWEITKRDLEDRKAELRNKDREAEVLEERHQMELKVYKQKVKHLLYEHQNHVALLKAESELAVKLALDSAAGRESELHREKRVLRQQLSEQEASNEEVIKALQLDHAKEVSKLKGEVEANARVLAAKCAHIKYDKRLRAAAESADLRRKQEVHEAEEAKNLHIRELTRKHERSYADIKAYYNDITANNLDLITALKEDVAELRSREAAADKLLGEVAAENKRLAEPLEKAQKEVAALQTQLNTTEKERVAAGGARSRLAACQKALKRAEWEGEVLLQRLERLQAERDSLAAGCQAAVQKAQQEALAKGMLAEKQLASTKVLLERRELELEQVLQQKENTIVSQQRQIAAAQKKHNDLIRTYEAKLAAIGVPVQDLGFQSLQSSTTVAPASLIVCGRA